MKNQIKLTGIIIEVGERFEYHKNTFQKIAIQIRRSSGVNDILNVVCRTDRTDIDKFHLLDEVEIIGEVRTRNYIENNKRKLEIYVYALSIDALMFETDYVNEVEIEGYVCKPVNMRTTPRGQTISDVFIAFNPNNHKKSYYIPVIMFNKIAENSNNLKVSNRILVKGRLQSRTYEKQLENSVITKTAYEIAASNFEILD